MNRDRAIEMINQLPLEFDLEELIEKLIIIDKIDKGLKQVEEGKVNTEEQAKAKLTKWLN